jgi:hypothetical protein
MDDEQLDTMNAVEDGDGTSIVLDGLSAVRAENRRGGGKGPAE